jgi:hypothetical protein
MCSEIKNKEKSMKKKIIALSLATLLCSSLVLAGGCAENEEKGTLAKVWSAYSTEKYTLL